MRNDAARYCLILTGAALIVLMTALAILYFRLYWTRVEPRAYSRPPKINHATLVSERTGLYRIANQA